MALRVGFEALVRAHGLEGVVSASGRPLRRLSPATYPRGAVTGVPDALPPGAVDPWRARSVLRHLAAHTDEDVDRTLEACDGALAVYAKAVSAGTTDGLLVGPPVAPAVRRYAEPRRL